MKSIFEEYALAMIAVFVIVALILMVDPVSNEVGKILNSEGNIKEVQVNNAVTYANTSQLKEVYSKIEADRVVNDSVMIDFSKVADQYKSTIEVMSSSTGFISPINGRHNISAQPWHYPESFGGGVHLGVDYAAEAGTEIIAPANGVVVASGQGCGTGFLGDKCKGNGENLVGAGGNQIWFITSVDNKVYVIAFFHLLDGTVTHTGPVEQGDKIAEVGSSGNSTGPHCHVEVFYLGEGDFSDIESKYMREEHSTSFGCTWGEYALNHICETEEDIRSITALDGVCRINAISESVGIFSRESS